MKTEQIISQIRADHAAIFRIAGWKSRRINRQHEKKGTAKIDFFETRSGGEYALVFIYLGRLRSCHIMYIDGDRLIVIPIDPAHNYIVCTKHAIERYFERSDIQCDIETEDGKCKAMSLLPVQAIVDQNISYGKDISITERPLKMYVPNGVFRGFHNRIENIISLVTFIGKETLQGHEKKMFEVLIKD